MQAWLCRIPHLGHGVSAAELGQVGDAGQAAQLAAHGTSTTITSLISLALLSLCIFPLLCRLLLLLGGACMRCALLLQLLLLPLWRLRRSCGGCMRCALRACFPRTVCRDHRTEATLALKLLLHLYRMSGAPLLMCMHAMATSLLQWGCCISCWPGLLRPLHACQGLCI